jgi:predicted Zn-dependent protease
MGGLAFKLLLAKKFEKSLEASDRAIAAAPGLIWLYTNRAHALMFLGRVEEARTLYRAHRGEKTQDNKIWEDAIREDFAELRKAGLTNPLMDEIERTFAKKH